MKALLLVVSVNFVAIGALIPVVPFAVAALSALGCTAQADTVVSGRHYRVVDGDTIHIGEHKIRLLGIDAPEREQECRGANGGTWACGRGATAMLRNLLEGSAAGVSCVIEGEDRYRRLLGVCYAGSAGTGIDVQRALVRAGLAVAEYDARYRADESRAKSEKRGLWAGEFKRPRDWRAERRPEN